MKIDSFQLTMTPYGTYTDSKTIRIEVRADGRVFNETDFQDVFGFFMKDAERRIRDLVAGKTPT